MCVSDSSSSSEVKRPKKQPTTSSRSIAVSVCLSNQIQKALGGQRLYRCGHLAPRSFPNPLGSSAQPNYIVVETQNHVPWSRPQDKTNQRGIPDYFSDLCSWGDGEANCGGMKGKEEERLVRSRRACAISWGRSYPD